MATPAEPKPAPKKQSTVKGIVIGLLVGLIAAAIAWFAGGMSKDAAWKGQVETLRREVETARTDAGRQQGIVSMLRARVSLQEAATDLERRNYGSASEKLRQADRFLTGLAESGPDAAALANLRRELTAIDLTVQSDVGAQRAKILALSESLGKYVPPPADPPAVAVD